ncbi:hypothetical protein, partial [Brevundimonas aurantiaca]|uniref:hypothetical protein n=1 Tax=Brevundimonas aurantiaca TaxID=74316 RepID=UPI001CD3ED44
EAGDGGARNEAADGGDQGLRRWRSAPRRHTRPAVAQHVFTRPQSEADEGLVGDLFTAVFDGLPKWSFRKTPLVSAISRRFDYKAERQQRK